jgi:hypothetical protein
LETSSIILLHTPVGIWNTKISYTGISCSTSFNRIYFPPVYKYFSFHGAVPSCVMDSLMRDCKNNVAQSIKLTQFKKKAHPVQKNTSLSIHLSSG